jgi:aspartyl-tRNA(Asn)/glutamyl-tRNA(Gln) amidotransferase subunit C
MLVLYKFISGKQQMAFTKTQLRKFANLIRIDISDEKLSDMNIDSIVEWLDKLQKIDTSGVLPMITPACPTPLAGGVSCECTTGGARADIITDGNIRDAVMANTPDKSGISRGYFAVPKVMDD